MASIEKRVRGGQLRWYARYRDPAGKQRVKVLDRKNSAENFLVTIEASKLNRSYVDPKQASRRFRDVAEEHWAANAHRLASDTTLPRKRSILDRHILPVIGDYPIAAIKRSTISAAVATWSVTLAPGTVPAGAAPGAADLRCGAGGWPGRVQPGQVANGPAHGSAAPP